MTAFVELQNGTIYCYARRLGLWASGGAFFAPISTEKKCGDLAPAREGRWNGGPAGERGSRHEKERKEKEERKPPGSERDGETRPFRSGVTCCAPAVPQSAAERKTCRRVARVCVAPPAISLNLSLRHLPLQSLHVKGSRRIVLLSVTVVVILPVDRSI